MVETLARPIVKSSNSSLHVNDSYYSKRCAFQKVCRSNPSQFSSQPRWRDRRFRVISKLFSSNEEKAPICFYILDTMLYKQFVVYIILFFDEELY